jgi:hypothetical protein
MNKAAAYFTVSALTAAAFFVACDDDTVPLRALPDEAGAVDSGNTMSGHPGKAQQTGRIVDLGNQGMGVPGATIQIGGQTLTADAKGNYTVLYPLNTPVDMVVKAPNYYTLLEGQWLLKQDESRGPTRLPSADTAKALLTALSPPLTPVAVNTSLGVISLWAIKKTGCDDEGGVTFDISPRDASTNIVYLKMTFPDVTLSAGVSGENPHAVIYNVPVDKPITVIAKHPKCSQLPYPQDDSDGFTYTGKVNVAPDNQTLAFYRVFLGPHVDEDAGTGTDSGTDAGTDASFDAADQ